MQREYAVAKTGDLADGEMRQVEAGETAVLLVRVAGEYHALGATCTHFGAKLADGVLSGDRLVCPWHKACFRVPDGRVQEPPALNDLPRFALRVDGDTILVTVPDDAPKERVPAMATPDPTADPRTFVIVGAGAAGNAAAEALRQVGYRGRVVMIGLEDRPPYDRTKLSKQYLGGQQGADKLPLRDPAFYGEHGIERRVAEVAAIDTAARRVAFADGSSLAYHALLMATGGRPRNLDVPGADLGNVFTLRTPDDATGIIAAAGEGARAVVVGDSFIGMETAASLTQRGCRVTVVGRGPVPFAKTLGEPVGGVFRRLHESKGVAFRLEAEVARFEGDGAVRAAVLEDGARLEADLVVVGIGVEPATGILRGIEFAEDGGVPVDAHLRAADGLWAAGDIAAFPDPISGERVRIEHWRVAEQHGRIAALNMAGRPTPYQAPPYFWTNEFGTRLDYAGHAEGWDELIVDGDLDAPSFVAYYVQGGRIVAASGVKRDRDLAALLELMRLDATPSPDEVRGGDLDLAARLAGQVGAAPTTTAGS
jgi:NADPH-dependent 2,4-dienoyl-CoA reductase/sulfur reductase-like enzyme/nitrite reductase/ring-hydroxylating ferredoxin subunit